MRASLGIIDSGRQFTRVGCNVNDFKDSQDEAFIFARFGMVGERSWAPMVSHPVGSAVDSSCAQLEDSGVDVGINPHPGITKHLRHFLVCNGKLLEREHPSFSNCSQQLSALGTSNIASPTGPPLR